MDTTYNAEVGRKGKDGLWPYTIRNPAGELHLSGRRRGTKEQVVAHAQELADNLNGLRAGWHHQPVRLPGTRRHPATGKLTTGAAP